jgi:hypothetical protein
VVEYSEEITDISKDIRPTNERPNHLIKASSYSYNNEYATSLGGLMEHMNFFILQNL